MTFFPQSPSQLLFLPGASGRTQLWEPVEQQLIFAGAKVHIGWPGFNDMPVDQGINSLDDLVHLVLTKIDKPTALIAQSMGGVIALKAALAKPELITHLVLTVTSGGIDLAKRGAYDWRPAFIHANPHLPEWFSSYQEDLYAQLPTIQIPSLLLWGDADPISPVSVGHSLAALLPLPEMHIITGADHDLAETHARLLAPLIQAFLARSF